MLFTPRVFYIHPNVIQSVHKFVFVFSIFTKGNNFPWRLHEKNQKIKMNKQLCRIHMLLHIKTPSNYPTTKVKFVKYISTIRQWFRKISKGWMKLLKENYINKHMVHQMKKNKTNTQQNMWWRPPCAIKHK
jgi:hypothetical protein